MQRRRKTANAAPRPWYLDVPEGSAPLPPPASTDQNLCGGVLVEPSAELVAGETREEIVALAEVVEPRWVGPRDDARLDHVPEMPQAVYVRANPRFGVPRRGSRLQDEGPVARLQQQELADGLVEGLPAPPVRVPVILHQPARVARRGTFGMPLDKIPGEMNLRREELPKLVNACGLVWCNQVLIAPAVFAEAKANMLQALKKFHDANPLVSGMSKEELRDQVNLGPEVFSCALDKLSAEKKLAVPGELVHLPGRGVVMKDEEAESKKIIENAFASAGLKVPSLKEVLAGLKVDKIRAQKIVTLLLRDKVLIKISEDLVFHQTALLDLRQKIAAFKTTAQKIDVARFKDMTGVSRKYAIPLLEYLDRERVTRRVGDERVIL